MRTTWEEYGAVVYSTTTLNPDTIRGDELLSDDHYGFKIIAVVGFANDWAAYIGPTTWSDERVAREGNKADREAAERLFPTLAANLHWRY